MRIEIRTPYWGAGSKYKWTKDGYNIRGVGIDLNLLNSFPELEIWTEKRLYRLNSQKALDFINHYGSIEKRKGVHLGIVSLSIMELLEGGIVLPPAREVKQDNNFKLDI